MAAKRKQDDKHLKLLRELGSKPDNKKCFDCEQRGPTYVNMTVGSFVCTRCSGILRGLNPPHRVKSISMTTFTSQEIEFLENHGNEFCRQTWLGLENSRTSSLESKDEQKVRDYMVQKYERKRWYIPPSQVKLNNSSSNSTPEAKPLKQVARNDSPKPTSSSSSSSPVTSKPAVKSAISIPLPGAVPGPALQAQYKPPTSVPSSESGRSAMDLLGDLGGDPFGQPQVSAQAGAPGGFANFGQAFSSQPPTQGSQPATFDPFGSSSNFNAFGSNPPQSGTGATFAATQQAVAPAAVSSSFNAFSSAPSQSNASFNAFGTTAPSQPAAGNFASFGAAPTPVPAASVGQTAQALFNLSISTPASTTASQQVSSSGDKYAAFSTLGTDVTATSSANSVDWSGGSTSSGLVDWSGGGVSKGGGGGGGGGGVNVLSGGGIDWGPGSNTNIKQPPTSSGVGLLSSGMSSGANPFGGQSTASSMFGQTSAQPVTTGSMGAFGAHHVPQGSGFGDLQGPQSGGFGAFTSAAGGTPAPGGMMNGGAYQMQAQPGGFPTQGGYGGAVPMQGGVAPMQGGVAAGQMGTGVPGTAAMPAGGFGMQHQGGFMAQGAVKPGFGGGGGAQMGLGGTPGYGGAGFGGSMQPGFGATPQQGMNMVQPMGMTQPAGAGYGAPGGMGQAQNATGATGFGAPTQGGWPQQQSNPFMGQTDGFGSQQQQQQQQQQRSTNPFM